MSLTDVQQVRLIIGDSGTPPHFADDALEGYLAIEGGDVRMAAASALDAWSVQLASTAHDVMLGDYRENTSAAAKAMREAADRLRKEAESTPAFAAVPSHSGPGSFPWLDQLTNAYVRGGR